MSLLETLGGAAFGSLLDFLFERAAGHQFLRFFREKKIDDMLITKLKLAMLTIGQVLIDLEERQITSSIVMRAWLGEIKDVVYDVEDILNEIDLLCRLKDKAEEEGSESSSNFDVEAKIREIIERLQLLTMHKDLVDWGGMGKRQLRKLPSTSFLDEPTVFGREEVADSMINFLKSEKADHSIVAIVGMPGVGKSTLAQWVFNHESVRKAFPYRLWVHVTPEFDVLKVYTALCESIRGGDCSITNLDILQRMLHEELKEKKFLVVFDDIWSDSFVHLETL